MIGGIFDGDRDGRLVGVGKMSGGDASISGQYICSKISSDQFELKTNHAVTGTFLGSFT